MHRRCMAGKCMLCSILLNLEPGQRYDTRLPRPILFTSVCCLPTWQHKQSNLRSSRLSGAMADIVSRDPEL